MPSADGPILEAQPGPLTAHMKSVFAKYEEEKQKRIRPDGPDQYVELKTLGDRGAKLRDEDLYVDHDALNAQKPNLADGDQVKLMILGGGMAGMMTAVHVIKQGIFKAEDIRIVDRASDYGGIWHYNRYPGVTSDVHSCLYLPMLDETGQMPTHRHAPGEEIREHFLLLADKFDLYQSAVFRTDISSMEWDEAARRWHVTMTQNRGPTEKPVKMKVKAQFFVWAGGLLTHPKLPNVPGLEDFAGTIMHTARWDYNLTGGSPAEPILSKLKNKRVGVIGSGASGIQVTRELAKWAQHLYVIHRTPPSVDDQGQQSIDPQWFKETCSGKGWWRRLSSDHNRQFDGEDIPGAIVDKFSECWQYKHLLGARHDEELSPDDVPTLIENAMKLDVERMDRIRGQIDAIVKNTETAQRLKPWHPTWCKRPLYLDNYYPIFNQPNVTLVGTDGKGIEKLTRHGVIAGGREYEVDFLICGSGFRPWGNYLDPSLRSEIVIRGKGGRTLSEKWTSDPGPASFHGILSNSFPNLFFLKPDQGTACLNTAFCMDLVAEHIACVLASALAKAQDFERLAIESTVEAEEAWIAKIAQGATWLAPISVCGPNFVNNELKQLSPEEQARSSRALFYAQGPIQFERVLTAWRDEGSMKGLMIRS